MKSTKSPSVSLTSSFSRLLEVFFSVKEEQWENIWIHLGPLYHYLAAVELTKPLDHITLMQLLNINQTQPPGAASLLWNWQEGH